MMDDLVVLKQCICIILIFRVDVEKDLGFLIADNLLELSYLTVKAVRVMFTG